ncbi:hypothetical protein [Geminocystis sp. NIES-3709]|uniref:hypothetical protein n=1 Tax=Geminocystis sp. NIES-3709 TaxID=1617448 RepID=UPI0005FC9D71|nr:hypothetical protein [Geminocystis sp. NIES-3709]BAQ64281.1 hypothetical protein GM3709_1046 [Geminocystis sp. NIES-3709]
MTSVKSLTDKLVGEILEEAGLIHPGQIQVALMEQSIYTHLKLGEILVLHNWVTQQTADFFGEEIKRLIKETKKRQIGYYLRQAGLLEDHDIKAIIEEQKKLGVKFGSLAVLRGCIKQETLTFFLNHFVPEISKDTHLQYADKITMSSKRQTYAQGKKNTNRIILTPETYSDSKLITTGKKTLHNYEELLEEGLDDIPWVN